MGLFSFFKRKPKQEIPALKTERPGLGYRLAKASQKNYLVKMALVYEGKPIRHFDVIIKAKSRDNAAFLADERVSIKVMSARLDRSKK